MEVGASPYSGEIVYIIFSNCIEEEDQPESKCNKVTRVVLKVLTIGCAIGGAVSNISVALKFGGKNLALGVSVATANFTTRTILGTWSYHNIIDGEIGFEGKIKRQIEGRKLNRSKRVAIKVTVFAIAFIAQTPRAYLAYVYNNRNVVYPILTYQSLVAVPAYSLDLTFTATLKLKNLSKFERKLNKIKGDMKKIIHKCRIKIIDLPKNEREVLVTSLLAFNHFSNGEDVTTFFRTVCLLGNLPPKPQTISQKVRQVASTILGKLTGVTTVAAQTGFYFWIGVKASQSFWDNEIFYYAIGSIILASNLYLTTKAMTNHSQKLFNQIFFNPKQLLTGDSVVSVVMPKTRAAVGLVTFGITTLSTGTAEQNVIDYFEGDIASILKVLVPISMFLLTHMASSDIADEICKEAIRRCSSFTESEQNFLKLVHRLKVLEFIVENMSLQNFAKLLIALPEDQFADLMLGKVNKDELRNYLIGR